MATAKIVVLLIITGLLVWRSSELQRRASGIRERTAGLLGAMKQPVRVTGSPLATESEALFEAPASRSALALSETSALLTLVFSSRSKLSREAAHAWLTFVRERNWSDLQGVQVIVDQLAPEYGEFSSIPGVSVLRMKDVRKFSNVTGVRTVPVALLFGGQTLRLMASGPVDSTILAEFASVLRQSDESVRTSPFFSERPSDDLLPGPDRVEKK